MQYYVVNKAFSQLSSYGQLPSLGWLHLRTCHTWQLVVYYCWFCYVRSLLAYVPDICRPSG